MRMARGADEAWLVWRLKRGLGWKVVGAPHAWGPAGLFVTGTTAEVPIYAKLPDDDDVRQWAEALLASTSAPEGVPGEAFADLTKPPDSPECTLQVGRVASLPAIGYEHLKANGIATPEKLLVVAHGIGLMPLEIPLPYPAAGLAGVKEGFVLEENMLISLDSLYFGAKLGPCHMENVYVITAGAPEPMYAAPLELIETVGAEPAHT